MTPRLIGLRRYPVTPATRYSEAHAELNKGFPAESITTRYFTARQRLFVAYGFYVRYAFLPRTL
jgi:hypothetical protein